MHAPSHPHPFSRAPFLAGPQAERFKHYESTDVGADVSVDSSAQGATKGNPYLVHLSIPPHDDLSPRFCRDSALSADDSSQVTSGEPGRLGSLDIDATAHQAQAQSAAGSGQQQYKASKVEPSLGPSPQQHHY